MILLKTSPCHYGSDIYIIIYNMGALIYLAVLHCGLLAGYLLVFYALASPPRHSLLTMPPTRSYPESSWVGSTYNHSFRVQNDFYA